MSDSDLGEKKGGVPSWQTAAPEKEEEKSNPEPGTREKVLEQAKKFLEEDEVKDASTDKKVAFLESKGLQGEEIQSLLGVSRNEEASKSTSTSPPPPQPSQAPQAPTTTYRPATPSQPPIITYPEFLTTPAHPTPLITKPRLLTTLYAFTFLTALLYGTNTYLVTPMVESLTSARLDLASTTSTNLQKLLAKLESMVSVVPEKRIEQTEEDEDDDPTELFHRDIGIQTSPPRSRSSSPAPNPTTAQVSRLSVLQTHLKELSDDSTSEGQHTSDLESTMGILREYLDGMAYVAPSYNFGYGGTSGGGVGKKEDDDEISKVKQGIRGVKGVLLSARSFPGGVRAR